MKMFPMLTEGGFYLPWLKISANAGSVKTQGLCK